MKQGHGAAGPRGTWIWPGTAGGHITHRMAQRGGDCVLPGAPAAVPPSLWSEDQCGLLGPGGREQRQMENARELALRLDNSQDRVTVVQSPK